MSNGHRTSAIARPARESARRASPVRHDHPRDPDRSRDPDRPRHHTRLSDFTRPIAPDRQLVRRTGHRWILAGFGVAVVAALLAALFVLPVQAWRRQKTEIAVKASELAVLTGTNGPLQAEVNRLETIEGARDAARDELSMVAPGEERISLLPIEPAGALPLPTGWPYDTMAQIVAVRLAPEPEAAPAAVVPSATAPAIVVSATVAPVASAPMP